MITMTIWVLVKLVGCIYRLYRRESGTTVELFDMQVMFGLSAAILFGEISLNLNKYYHPAQTTTIG